MLFLSSLEKKLCRIIAVSLDSQIKLAFKESGNRTWKNLITPFFAGYCSGYAFLAFSNCHLEFSDSKKKRYFKHIFRHVRPSNSYQIFNDLMRNIQNADKDQSCDFDNGLKHGAKDCNSLAELGGLEARVDTLYRYLTGQALTEEEEIQKKIKKKNQKRKRHEEVVDGIKDLRNARAAKISLNELSKSKANDESNHKKHNQNILSQNQIDEKKEADTKKYLNESNKEFQISEISSEFITKSYFDSPAITDQADTLAASAVDPKSVQLEAKSEKPAEQYNNLHACKRLKRLSKARDFWFYSFTVLCVYFSIAIYYLSSNESLIYKSMVQPQDYMLMPVEELLIKAQSGDPFAQFVVGYDYANGIGIAENDMEAVKWYSIAAEKGDSASQFNLGVMYANGEGVVQSKIIAHMWWTLSAEAGNERAYDYLDMIENQMTHEMLEMAQEVAQLCREASFKSCISLP